MSLVGLSTIFIKFQILGSSTDPVQFQHTLRGLEVFHGNLPGVTERISGNLHWFLEHLLVGSKSSIRVEGMFAVSPFWLQRRISSVSAHCPLVSSGSPVQGSGKFE